jgi:hypothetical protein
MTQKYDYAAFSWGESWGDKPRRMWRKTADKIDAVVHEMIYLWIIRNREDRSSIASKLDDHWSEMGINFDSKRQNYLDLIRLAEKELAGAKTRWENSTLPELVQEAEAAYRKIKNNIATYQAGIAQINALEADHGRQAELRKWLFETMADYRGLSLDDKRLVLQLSVERVEAHISGPDLEIKVVYRGGKTESRTIGLGNADWTSKECNTLIDLAEHGATPLQMAGFMPNRNLGSIIAKYWRLTGRGISAKDCLIRKDETFHDFLARQPEGYATAWTLARKSHATLLDFLSCAPEEAIRKSLSDLENFYTRLAHQPEGGIIEHNNEVVTSNGSLCSTFYRIQKYFAKMEERKLCAV